MKKFYCAVFIFSLFFTSAWAETPPVPLQVRVDVSDQKLYLFRGKQLLKVYPVSTAKNGIGNRLGSERTPLGWHRVAQKIGAGAPIYTIFINRKNTGSIYAGGNAKKNDLITSRILWLEGLEPGINKGKGIDSFSRFIYIHGTAEEELIGRPSSHGCIRMKNTDVVELFNLLPLHSKVLITA